MPNMFKSRWWVVVAGVLGMIVGQGPVAIFTFGVFLKPVTDDLGVSRGSLSSAITVMSLLAAIVTPLMGRLIDRFGTRPVLLPMIVLFALSTMALSLLQASIALCYLLFGLQGAFSASQSPTAYVRSISAWFDRRRGLALGIAQAGVGLGVALMPQLAAYLISSHGWRVAYIGLGGAILALAFLPVALFVREPPTSSGQRPISAAGSPGASATEAWRSTTFLLLNACFFLAVMAINGTLTHAIALLTDRGVSLQMATGALSFAGLALIAGRLLAGYCLDHVHGRYVAVGSFCCPIIGIALLATATQPMLLLAGTALCGLGIGAEIDLMAYLVGRYFGLRAYATIYGLLFAIFTLGTGLGPYLMGFAFDYFHGYGEMLAAFEVALVAACILAVRLGPYVYPERPATAPERGGMASQSAG
jgi:MFS family permease